MIGKVESSTIYRERRKAMIAVLEVEVTNITHIKPQQTNALKMTKENGLHYLKLRKWKGEKRPFFDKKRPYKQKQEERFETVEIKTMTKARPIIMTNKTSIQ